MSTTNSPTKQATFAKLQAQYQQACEREQQYRETVLWPKYREFRPSTSWLTMTERKRLDSLRAQQDRIGERFFALLDDIGGRSFRTGCPYGWALESLTYDDATTTGAMSVVPPTPYSYSDREVSMWAAQRAD